MAEDLWAEFKPAGTAGTSDVDPWAEFKVPEAKGNPSESNTLFGDGTASTTLGEFGAGLQKGVRQIVSTAPMLAAMATRKVEDWTGADTHGLDEALAQTAVEIAEGGAKRGISKVEALELLDPSTWTRYVAGTIGETVPFVASILTGAGGARFLASYMAKKGVSASTRAGILATVPAEVVGAVATGSAIETAATAQELFQAKKDIYTGAPIIAGTAKGALESVFPLMLGKALGLTGGQATHLLDRLYIGSGRAGRTATGAAVEGGTELLQEEVDIITRNFVDENYAYLSPEANSRRLNAFVGGFTGGAFFSQFHSSNPQTALSDSDVRKAAGDVPYIIGASNDELPTSGPEAAIDTSLSGLDATVGIANQAELDDLQSTVDIRRRGLYAAAIPGTELTFGSQDQALNDGANAQVKEYLKLDPNQITRGDVSVSVEDLPSTVASPRVDFTAPATLKEAQDNLVEAIKWKEKAAAAKSPSAIENHLAKAAVYYRQAMNYGARVEPFADSQIVLRNPAKHQQLMAQQSATELTSMLSKAQLRETRTRDNGSQFYVLSRPTGTESAPGRSIDLERVRPGDVTAFPTQDMSRQVQADQLVARKLDLGRAKAKGIRFEGKLDEAAQKVLLGEFVQFLQSAGKVSKGFQKMPKAVVERFMSMVDRGLRLDVNADTNAFALLRKLGHGGFTTNIDVVGPEVARSKDLRRIVKQRARRAGDTRVSSRIVFADKNVEEAFMGLLHGTSLQRMLAGDVGGGPGKKYQAGISPLGNMLRELLKPMQIKTDIVIQIVAPGSLKDAVGTTKGVLYQEQSVVLTEGKKAQPRSVLLVDPWFYSRDTIGGKVPESQSQAQERKGIGKKPTPAQRGWFALTGQSNTAKQFVDDAQASAFVTDIAHEVGKIIVTFEWEAMGTAQQELFKIAYRRERHAMTRKDKEHQLARVIPHPTLERTIGEQRGRHRHSYNFEEWMVSNIARWMVQPNTPVGPVQKFFKKVAGSIEKFINGLVDRIKNKEKPLALDPNLGRPNFVVESWLTKLQQRGKVVEEEPFLSEATRRALMDSINRNQAAMAAIGLDQYVVAFPERSSTYRVRQLLKIFPKDAHADRAKMKGLLATADRHNTMMEWLLGIHQMADMNPHIAGLTAYKSLNRAMENTALSWSSLADKRIRDVQKLGKAQSDALWRVLFDLDQMVYLDRKKLDDGTERPRWPTPDELLAIVKKHGLSKEAFGVYTSIRQDFLQFLSYLEEVSIQKAIETIQDETALAKEVSTISGEVAQMKARPYFPHMRFGKYVVTVRDGQGSILHFEAFNTRKERDGAVLAIEKKYKVPSHTSLQEDELSPTLQQWQGLPPFALRNIERELGLDQPDLTTQQKKDKKLLEALALQAAPTTSFRRQLLERQNTPGFSMDGLRAYGTYFARAARFVARQEYTKRLEAAIKDVRDTGSPISKDVRTRIADYMTRHYENLMQPSSDWAEMRALGYLWYFAYVPAAAFVNLTQVPMVTMPYLASRFGDLTTMGRTLQAMKEASSEYFRELRGTTPKDEGVLSEALEEAHESRLIDDGFAQELAAISQGSVLQRTLSTSKFGRELRRLGQWGVTPFTIAERINRAVTFRAAYKMALADNGNAYVDAVMAGNQAEANQLRVDRGWDEPHLRAYMVAADAVRTTQFEYSRWARPKLMEGPRGVLLMFKSYVQNMLFFMFKQDKGTQIRFLLGLMGVAGIMGLPGADDAEELAKWLMRQFGVQFDFEKWVRAVTTDWVEGVSPDIILHGASRVGFGIPAALSGLGIPSATPDLSGSLSMGQLIPGLKSFLNPETSSWKETVGQVTSEVAGPWLGVPFSLYQSITDQSLPADDPKRWERTLPRALRSVGRASRLMAEQRERDRGGATVVDFDPNDWSDQMDIMSIAGGFNPTQMSRQWDYLRAQREVQMYWQGQRELLTRELVRAKRLKDKEGIDDAIAAIKEFNEEAPDKALRITSDTLRRSLQTSGRNQKLRERGIPLQKSLRGVSQQLDALYPEAVTRREKVPK